jgi:hypothetical protein
MPAVASTVDATCLDAGSTDRQVVDVAPVRNPATPGLVRKLGGDRRSLTVNLDDEARELFTEGGTRVPFTVGAPGTLLFRAPAGAVSVTVILWHSFGENASALNAGAITSVTAQLPVAATPTPSPSPTTPTPTGDGLAPSGGPGSLVLLGLLLIAGGTALTVRRARDRAAFSTRP